MIWGAALAVKLADAQKETFAPSTSGCVQLVWRGRVRAAADERAAAGAAAAGEAAINAANAEVASSRRWAMIATMTDRRTARATIDARAALSMVAPPGI
jgi:hypothetical protein